MFSFDYHYSVVATFLVRPFVWLWNIAISVSVCLCVCLSMFVISHISKTTTCSNLQTFVACSLSSVFLWLRCDTLCSSGFDDDVTISRNGQAKATRKGRTLNVTHKGAPPGAKSDVYDCLVFFSNWNWQDNRTTETVTVYVAVKSNCYCVSVDRVIYAAGQDRPLPLNIHDVPFLADVRHLAGLQLVSSPALFANIVSIVTHSPQRVAKRCSLLMHRPVCRIVSAKEIKV